MDKEQALKEYKAALKVALEKRSQYTYYYFKELYKDHSEELSEELLNNIADTCTQAFFERMQREHDVESEFKDKELLNTNEDFTNNHGS